MVVTEICHIKGRGLLAVVTWPYPKLIEAPFVVRNRRSGGAETCLGIERYAIDKTDWTGTQVGLLFRDHADIWRTDDLDVLAAREAAAGLTRSAWIREMIGTGTEGER